MHPNSAGASLAAFQAPAARQGHGGRSASRSGHVCSTSSAAESATAPPLPPQTRDPRPTPTTQHRQEAPSSRALTASSSLKVRSPIANDARALPAASPRVPASTRASHRTATRRAHARAPPTTSPLEHNQPHTRDAHAQPSKQPTHIANTQSTFAQHTLPWHCMTPLLRTSPSPGPRPPSPDRGSAPPRPSGRPAPVGRGLPPSYPTGLRGRQLRFDIGVSMKPTTLSLAIVTGLYETTMRSGGTERGGGARVCIRRYPASCACGRPPSLCAHRRR